MAASSPSAEGDGLGFEFPTDGAGSGGAVRAVHGLPSTRRDGREVERGPVSDVPTRPGAPNAKELLAAVPVPDPELAAARGGMRTELAAG
jgi:hypothetical protein